MIELELLKRAPPPKLALVPTAIVLLLVKLESLIYNVPLFIIEPPALFVIPPVRIRWLRVKLKVPDTAKCRELDAAVNVYPPPLMVVLLVMFTALDMVQLAVMVIVPPAAK